MLIGQLQADLCAIDSKMLTKRLPTIDRGIRDTSCQISFKFLFIKTRPPDKLHNGFGFVIQFRVGIRYVICQGGNFFRKRNSKEIWREVSLIPRPTTSQKRRARHLRVGDCIKLA